MLGSYLGTLAAQDPTISAARSGAIEDVRDLVWGGPSHAVVPLSVVERLRVPVEGLGRRSWLGLDEPAETLAVVGEADPLGVDWTSGAPAELGIPWGYDGCLDIPAAPAGTTYSPWRCATRDLAVLLTWAPGSHPTILSKGTFGDWRIAEGEPWTVGARFFADPEGRLYRVAIEGAELVVRALEP